MSRRGMSLAEVLVGAVVLAVIVVALATLVSTTASTAAGAGEHQLAATMGARAVDTVVGAGYRSLYAQRDTSWDLPLARLAEVPADGRALVVDGVTFTAVCHVDEPGAGLLRVTIAVRWSTPRGPSHAAERSVTLVRYVADPLAGIRVRSPGGPAV